jgi:hypothetical protein
MKDTGGASSKRGCYLKKPRQPSSYHPMISITEIHILQPTVSGLKCTINRVDSQSSRGTQVPEQLVNVVTKVTRGWFFSEYFSFPDSQISPTYYLGLVQRATYGLSTEGFSLITPQEKQIYMGI